MDVKCMFYSCSLYCCLLLLFCISRWAQNKYYQDKTLHLNIHEIIPKAAPDFPIDVVITWAGIIQENEFDIKTKYMLNERRIRDNNELKYLIRSIFKYAPWVRKIYVTKNDNSSCPKWLNTSRIMQNNAFIQSMYGDHFINFTLWNQKIMHKIIGYQCINHSEQFFNKSYGQKTRNSFSIELKLHHIQGLSEHYIYFNDDFFLFRDTPYTLFFNTEGIPRFPKVYWTNKIHAIIKIYPQKDIDRMKLNINIPLSHKHKNGPIYHEHMPRSFLKTDLYLLEQYYLAWFKWQELHWNTRFCPNGITMKDCFNDCIYTIMTTFRILGSYFNNNDTSTMNLNSNILQDIHSQVKQFGGNDFFKKFKIDIYNFEKDGFQKKDIHYWLVGKQDLSTEKKLKSLQKKIEQQNPFTVCMNDLWALDRSSAVYQLQKDWLISFLEKHFERCNIEY